MDYLYAYRGEQYADANGNVDPMNMSTEYQFTSPWSLNLSAGITMGKTAFGLEYEKHFTQRSSLSVGNTRINSQGSVDYNDYSSLKIGFEQNISNLSLRAGYNLIEPMFNEKAQVFLGDTDFNVKRMDFQMDRLGKRQYFTCGMGYCSAPDRDGTQFYVDMAYVHGVRNSVLNVCEYTEDFDVNYNYKTDKVLFTIGWNF